MKISVCGKGGSGKSTVVSLLASAARAKGYRVLVVDADESNSGLFRMLGFDHPPVPLMELVGGKKSLKQKIGQPSILADSRIALRDLSPEHLVQRDGLMLVGIGKILQSLEGCACPMGALSREFLKKLALAEDEMAIVDMEAGVEHFGRGVDTSLDSVLIVVEPPLESVDVAQKVHELASEMGVRNVWAVMNKVPSDGFRTRLEAELHRRSVPVVGCIHFDNDVFSLSVEGGVPTDGRATEETRDTLDVILERAGVRAPSGDMLSDTSHRADGA